jgi:hypothetical protein
MKLRALQLYCKSSFDISESTLDSISGHFERNKDSLCNRVTVEYSVEMEQKILLKCF